MVTVLGAVLLLWGLVEVLSGGAILFWSVIELVRQVLED